MQIPRFGRFVQRNAWLLRNRNTLAIPHSRPRPRLLIDVSVISQRDAQTGIQRVVRALWSEITGGPSADFDIVPVFASSRHGYCEAPSDFLNDCPLAESLAPVTVRAGDIFLGLDLSAQFIPAYRQQLRRWRAAGVRINVVAYDLLPLMRPDFFLPRTVANFKRWFATVARVSDQIFCISRQVARDVREHLPGIQQSDGRRPAVRHLAIGADMSASRPSTGVTEELARLLDRMRFRPTILLVGTVEPRKGYCVALAAFDHLWRNFDGEAPDMVIAGKPGWKARNLQRQLREHPEHGRRLHWVSTVSDEGLCRLYEACRGLLMTSHAEGFGLPLLEAASHRRYALARDLPVFREHNLANVIFFEDDEPRILGEAILQLARRGSRDCPSSTLPTWSQSAEQLLADLGLSSGVPASQNSSAVAL